MTGVLGKGASLDVAGATGLQLDVHSAAADEVLAGIDGALAAAAQARGPTPPWSACSSG